MTNGKGKIGREGEEVGAFSKTEHLSIKRSGDLSSSFAGKRNNGISSPPLPSPPFSLCLPLPWKRKTGPPTPSFHPPSRSDSFYYYGGKKLWREAEKKTFHFASSFSFLSSPPPPPPLPPPPQKQKGGSATFRKLPQHRRKEVREGKEGRSDKQKKRGRKRRLRLSLSLFGL